MSNIHDTVPTVYLSKAVKTCSELFFYWPDLSGVGRRVLECLRVLCCVLLGFESSMMSSVKFISHRNDLSWVGENIGYDIRCFHISLLCWGKKSYHTNEPVTQHVFRPHLPFV